MLELLSIKNSLAVCYLENNHILRTGIFQFAGNAAPQIRAEMVEFQAFLYLIPQCGGHPLEVIMFQKDPPLYTHIIVAGAIQNAQPGVFEKTVEAFDFFRV